MESERNKYIIISNLNNDWYRSSEPVLFFSIFFTYVINKYAVDDEPENGGIDFRHDN